ncbi:MAG: DNA polymerase III subunit delta' [Alphaproteobacteria bacterium]
MGFAEIIGQQKALDPLRAALAQGRLHHAYLFHGPEGVGKRTIGLALAQAIHCDQMADDFCGHCVNCLRIKSGNHPDVRLIEPTAGKKEISIQQIRSIEKELSFRAFSGKKIAIIDPATLMNLPAQNALLKTLEEPPPDSLLILVASNAGGLLPTVRSRCLRIAFGPLPRELIAGYLAAKQTMTQDDARLVAAMSMGSLGAALDLDREELVEQRRNWIETMRSLKPGNYQTVLNAAEALSGSREESLKFLAWMETWYRDLLIYCVTREARELINLDMVKTIQQQSAAGNPERILEALSQAAGAAARIQRNLNRRMILEELFMAAAEAR